MKKRNKGTAGFIIGIIVYVLSSILAIMLALTSFAQAERSYAVEQHIYVMSGVIGIFMFIALTLWFLSFSVGYNQRKTQIELLQELSAKKD